MIPSAIAVDKFPGATDAQLGGAHAYASGGSAAQDIGY
jgi:hypothetical protein